MLRNNLHPLFSEAVVYHPHEKVIGTNVQCNTR